MKGAALVSSFLFAVHAMPVEAGIEDYQRQRERASQIVGRLGARVPASEWTVEQNRKHGFITLRSADHRLSFQLSDGDCFSYFFSSELGARNRKRPDQGDRYGTEAAWAKQAESVINGFWPNLKLEHPRVRKTGEENSGGKLWHSNSNLVSVDMDCPKPKGMVVGFSVTFDRGTGTVLSFGRSKARPRGRAAAN